MKTGIEGFGTKGSYNLGQDDKSMSIEHLKDTLEYNLRHAEDHMKKAKEACERLHANGEECRIPKSIVDLGKYFESDIRFHQTDVDGKITKIAGKVKS